VTGPPGDGGIPTGRGHVIDIDGEADFAIQFSKAIGMKEADFTL
jgi:hypothetical protein